MKNAIRTFAMLLALGFTTSAFAGVAPTSKGEGTFKCTVVEPMTITADAGTADLGILLATDEKTDFSAPGESAKLTWNITGVGATGSATMGHKYFYKIKPVVDNSVAAVPATATEGPKDAVPATVELTMGWTIADGTTTTAPTLGTTTPSFLTATGTSKIEATVTKVVTNGAAVGPYTFKQNVEVSYATF